MKKHNLAKTLHHVNLKKLTKLAVPVICTLLILSMISAFPSSIVQARTFTWNPIHWWPTPTPTATPTPTPKPIATPTPTPKPIATPTPTPTPTPTATPTPTPTPTATPTPTPTPTLAPKTTSVPTPTPTPTATPTGTYSYTMDTSGSNYQILNSANTPIYTSTSSSTAFNYLLGTTGKATSDNTICIKSGAYTVDATWNININSVTVTFQPGAVLTAINNLNTKIMWIYGNFVTVTGATINGNGLNQLPSAKTMLTGSNFNDGITYSGNNDIIYNCTVYNVRCFGIIAAYEEAGNNNGVIDCTVYNCGANGISDDPTSTNDYFINNVVYGCSDVAVDAQGENTTMTGNYVHDCSSTSCPMYGYGNSYWGIAVEAGANDLIANNTIINVGNGIELAECSTSNGATNCIISGNILTNCQLNDYDGVITLHNDPASSYNTIEFNSITTASIGIFIMDSTCSGNNIWGNAFSVCTINIINSGTGTTQTQPSVVVVTVTSSPIGSSFISVNGAAELYPAYTFQAKVGSKYTLTANNVSGYTFTSWSDNGTQTHTITVPSSNAIYTANY